MLSKIKSWTIPSLERSMLIGLGCAFLLLVLAFYVAQFAGASLGDIPVYKYYAHRIFSGDIPYHGLNLEYPPGVLPFILLAVPMMWLLGSTYIEGYMALTYIAVAVYFAHRYQVGRRRAILISVILFLPLLQFFFFNLDIFAAVGLYGAIYALQKRRFSLSAVLLAASTLIKGYPGVCLLGLFWLVPAQYRKRYLTLFTSVMGAALLPLAILAPHGLWYALTYHTGRPAEFEATSGAIGFLLHLVGNPLHIVYSHGSWSLLYRGEGAINAACSIGLGLSLLAISLLVKRGWLAAKPASISLLLLATYMLLFKVGSPQYFIAVLIVAPLAVTELSQRSYQRLLALCMITATSIWLLFAAFFVRRGTDLQSATPLFAGLTSTRAILLATLIVFLVRELHQQARFKKPR